MKNSCLILLVAALVASLSTLAAQIVDQHYTEAQARAKAQNKMLLIDGYTTWCAPCKELDKYVYENDSITTLLEQDFVILKYDVENDSVYHLAKKHHIMSYPSTMVLNPDGYLVAKLYGTPGNGPDTLVTGFMEFARGAKNLAASGYVVPGVSNTIDTSLYPKSYIDFVDRRDTDPDPEELRAFWRTQEDRFAEEYFAVMVYFSDLLPYEHAEFLLANREEYARLFGETDVASALEYFTWAKLNLATKNKDEQAFLRAEQWAKRLGTGGALRMLDRFTAKMKD